MYVIISCVQAAAGGDTGAKPAAAAKPLKRAWEGWSKNNGSSSKAWNKVKCYTCKQFGHMASQCPKNANGAKKQRS